MDFDATPSIEEVYEQFFPKVYSYVFYKLLHKEETEDLVSRVFLKIVQNLHRYDARKASIGTWVFTIVDNALIDYYRRRRLNLSIDDEASGVAGALRVDFDAQLEQIAAPERRAVYRVLATLPERERTFIYYKYFERMTNREIARRMGMNESTVGAILSRTRAKLKKRFLDEGIT